MAAIMGGPGGVASPLSPVGEVADLRPVFDWAPVASASAESPTSTSKPGNTTDAPLSVEVAYHGERAGDEPLRTDGFALEPRPWN